MKRAVSKRLRPDMRVKIAKMLVFLAGISVLAGATSGAMNADLLFGVLVACAPAAVCVSLAALVMSWADSARRLPVLIAWVFVALVSLAAALASGHSASAERIQVTQTLLGWVSVCFSFPLSFALLYFLVDALSLPLGGADALGTVTLWLVFAVPGFVQWFVLIPLVMRLFKRSKSVST